MTLVVTINGPETIWLLADRRLCSPFGKPLKDDAGKVMFLETPDGVAILSYAGLGATARGTEPAEWMSAALRGKNVPLEQALGQLTSSMQRQFPQHMRQMPRALHSVVSTAFVNEQARLYLIELMLAPDRKSYKSHYTRYGDVRPVPLFAVAGSGAACLNRDRHWARHLSRLVKAHERGKVSTEAVADALAKLNHEVHLKETTVGPRCIVAWRHRRKGLRKGGGAQRFYTGAARDPQGPIVPCIANGMDIRAVVTTLMPHMLKQLEAVKVGKASELPVAELNADLARIPEEPDEKLR